MICNNCKKSKLISVEGCGGEVVYKCEMCGNRYVKKYDASNFPLEFYKDNYDSPKEWAESTIKAHSFHGEIPKEYLDRLKKCQTWDDVILLEKDVVPYLIR